MEQQSLIAQLQTIIAAGPTPDTQRQLEAVLAQAPEQSLPGEQVRDLLHRLKERVEACEAAYRIMRDQLTRHIDRQGGVDVLIIDDDEDLRDLVALQLLREGLVTAVAPNAQAGLSMLEQQLPRCVLMDLEMPGMDGLTATQVIKERQEYKDLPVIIFTASSSLGHIRASNQAGAFAFIPKGFEDTSLQMMVSTVRKALAQGAGCVSGAGEERAPFQSR